MMSKWRVVSFDVWGNQKDGYEVNDLFKEGTIELDDSWNEDRIFIELKRNGLINKRIRRKSLTIRTDVEDFIWIESARHKDCGYPIYQLEKEF